MKKEYKYNITPTAKGNLWTVEVLHDGKYVSEMRQFFNHKYTGKAPNKKIIQSSREQAQQYMQQLEKDGYIKINKF